MGAATGSGADHVGICVIRRYPQASDEIGGKKRRIGGKRRQPDIPWPMCRRPHHARQDACKRPRETLDYIDHDVEAKTGEASRIAIGVEQEMADLWSRTIDYPLEQGDACEFAETLVTATHTACLPAG